MNYYSCNIFLYKILNVIDLLDLLVKKQYHVPIVCQNLRMQLHGLLISLMEQRTLYILFHKFAYRLHWL